MLPESTKEQIDYYRKHRVPPGGFLQAVYENDLFGAVGKADQENRENLPDIVSYCFQTLPTGSWGSKSKVSKWLRGDTNEYQTTK